MEIQHITVENFRSIESKLKDIGQNSDNISFEEIKKLLKNPSVLSAESFAEEVIYVVLASGFRQETAKKVFVKIIDYIKHCEKIMIKDLLSIFGNTKKINAIYTIWNNRNYYRDIFYSINKNDEKVEYLGNLPHIGEITKNHIARNLGINIVKYDRWIVRLGIILYGENKELLNNTNIKFAKEIKLSCDKMFMGISKTTGEMIGYIDVVLFKACQQGILKIVNHKLYLFL